MRYINIWTYLNSTRRNVCLTFYYYVFIFSWQRLWDFFTCELLKNKWRCWSEEMLKIKVLVRRNEGEGVNSILKFGFIFLQSSNVLLVLLFTRVQLPLLRIRKRTRSWPWFNITKIATTTTCYVLEIENIKRYNLLTICIIMHDVLINLHNLIPLKTKWNFVFLSVINSWEYKSKYE